MVALTGLLLLSFHLKAGSWELLQNERNVQVFKQTMSEQPDRFLVQTEIKSKPITLLNLLLDLKNNPNWVDGSLGVSLIKQLSNNENLVKTQLKAPWPFTNRELVNYSHYYQDKRSCALFIDIIAKPNAIAEDPDFVRITQFQANWSVLPLSATHSLIRYSGWVEAGNFIPQYLSNHIAQNSLFTTFINLRRQLIKTKYQSAPLPQGFSHCQPHFFYQKNKINK